MGKLLGIISSSLLKIASIDDETSCLPQLLLLLYSPLLFYSVQVRLQIGIDAFDIPVGSYHVMCMA